MNRYTPRDTSSKNHTNSAPNTHNRSFKIVDKSNINDIYSVEINGKYLPIPYNKKNRQATPNDIINIIKKYGVDIVVTRMDMFMLALTHKSYIKKDFYMTDQVSEYKKKMNFTDTIELQDKSNQRLEFLGDTQIKSIISDYLFDRYEEQDEGFMTKLKAKLENKKIFASFAKLIGIEDYLLISVQHELKTGRSSLRTLEDAFEAFIGALYKNSGYDICHKFIFNILETEVDYANLLYNDDNYKALILQYYHKNKWEHPVYVTLKTDGPPNKRIFTMGIKDVHGAVIGIGKGSSKSDAEQLASKKALQNFKLLNDDQIDE
ncbi:MAG: putative dsRNA-specific ribonuclease III [Faunusvirus sp.]|jgi:ribonuclease-3|uniref:Putative dsRNA-specific ribonuclease III n=1 Tax=Faunusvirus sp. TaxID=2487766 RepID=A0A3G4ZX63_9VIRU|nr:MAG: putative dsRNA-specific ribonuclease III [Faunusvirus sp.]